MNNVAKKMYSGRYFPQKKRIEWTPRTPDGTCYEKDLYGEAEELFFKPLDDKSAKILNRLEDFSRREIGKFEIGEDNHRKWAIFISGLLVRSPTNIKWLQKLLKENQISENCLREHLPAIIENEKVISDLRSLNWFFAENPSNLELITCDTPLVFKPQNLSDPDCVLILSMSPTHFFLATKQDTFLRLPRNPREMVSHINAEIVQNATERVYARTRNSIKENFVIKYWRG